MVVIHARIVTAGAGTVATSTGIIPIGARVVAARAIISAVIVIHARVIAPRSGTVIHHLGHGMA